MRKSSSKPLVQFDLPIRTCSKAKNKWGYSPRAWEPGYLIRFRLFTDDKHARFKADTGALFEDYLIKTEAGTRIGQVTLTLDQFDVGTLSHECLHAIYHWGQEYRPKEITPLCGEEMLAYGIASLITDSLASFEKRGFVILAD